MKIDPTKAVVPNLLLLLKEVNPAHTLTDQSVTFSDPVAFADPSGINNTKITITALKNKGYKNSVTIAYRRLTFDQAFPNMTTTWMVAGTDTVSGITNSIMSGLSALSTEFTLNSGNAITLPTLLNQKVNVSLTPKPNSKIFLTTATKSLTLQMILPVVEVTYSGTGNNLNTTTLLGSPTGIAEYRLTITGTIGSTSTANPALTIGTLPAGSILKVINKGTIQGCGGVGGNQNSAGAIGGPAIKALMNFSLDTSLGKVFGGGGGGGGCGQTFGLLGINWLNAAGGGGSGINPGAAGSGTGLAGLGLQTNNAAAPGTATAGGVGAKTSSMSDATQYSQAGRGGAPGAAGGAGVASKGTSSATVTNFPGGAAGKAIDLNGFAVTFIAGNNTTQIKGAVA